MIRDVLNAIQSAVAQVQPPGTSAIVPGPGTTGVVAFDPTNAVFGTYNGVIQAVTPGAVGTATVKISLDGGRNFDAPFTVPASPFPVPLPAFSPSLLSPGLSGLVLNFSGNFSASDTFSFQALPSVTFLSGAEELSGQDTLFPRVVLVPLEDDFQGTEDFAGPYGGVYTDQRTQPRALVTAVARFEAHCWGQDYDRTELLRDTVVNGIHYALQAVKRIVRGRWVRDETINKAGRLYVLEWSVLKPVLSMDQTTQVVQPPFTDNVTTQIQSQ